MSSSSTIRWGIVTAGRIAHTFASDIQHCDDTYIHAVASRTQKSATRFAEQYAIPHAYEGYEKLFNDPDIDAIYIGSPHSLHKEHALAALQAGKHVLCEKPITLTEEELNELIEAATQNNCFLMEAMWTYFLPAIRQAQKWVTAGEIGELLHVKADFGYPVPYSPVGREYELALGGGCTYDMGIYPIAFNRLFNQEPVEREFKHLQRAPNGADNDAIWQWQHGSKTASLHTSFRSKLPNTAYLIGTRGTIEIPDFFRASICRLFEHDAPKLVFEDHRKGSGFEFEIDHACECIRQGEIESAIMPWDRSRQFQQDIARILRDES